MKLLIAGSRTFEFDHDFINEAILAAIGEYRRYPKINEVVSGGAKGIDTAAESFAEAWELPFKLFPADWETHGKAAGHIRNKQMAEYADALLLIWDGESRGSANMRETMLKLKKPVFEVVIRRVG